MKTIEVPVGVSGRHIHLSAADLEALFGTDYRLEEYQPLLQRGQFAAEEVLSVVGPKGQLDGVRVIGPVRPATQVEVSRSDAYKLGIAPPVRASGDLEGTPGLTLIGPKGRLPLSEGVILAHRHLHMSCQDAERLGLRNHDRLTAKTEGVRAVIFENVLVRVKESYILELHLDTDEGNAALLNSGDTVTVFLPEPEACNGAPEHSSQASAIRRERA